MAGAEKLKAAPRRARITQRTVEKTSSQNDPLHGQFALITYIAWYRFPAARDALVGIHHVVSLSLSPLSFHPILDPRGDKTVQRLSACERRVGETASVKLAILFDPKRFRRKCSALRIFVVILISSPDRLFLL